MNEQKCVTMTGIIVTFFMKKIVFHPLPMIIVLGVLLLVGYLIVHPPQEAEVPTDPYGEDYSNVETYKDLLRVTSPKVGEEVSLPFVIRGEARGNWFFEATFPINIVDDSGKVLLRTYAEAKADWMTENFVPFEVVIDHLEWGDAEVGNILLMKSNASGLAEHNDQYLRYFLFPASEDYTTLNLFWGNSLEDPDVMNCEQVYATQRTVKKTEGVGGQALELLLQGPTDREESNGFFTSIPAGTKLESAAITDGIFTAEFSSKLDEGIGGSCLVQQIRSQIEQTLKQFSTVEEVRIVVEGKQESEVLQP